VFLYFCKAPITNYIFAHFLYFIIVIVRLGDLVKLVMFQRRDPQIHILYEEMFPYKNADAAAALRHVKADLVESKSGRELIDIRHKDVTNQLSDDLVVVGRHTKKHLLNWR